MAVVQALGREWSWPDEDTKCREVVFDWSRDLKVVYQYCKNFRTAVQAGGNMGVWPWLMAKKFQKVHTFEPDPRCIPHLLKNTEAERENGKVVFMGFGLSDHRHNGTVRNDAKEVTNLGAQYVVSDPEGEIALCRLDSACIPDVDLIYLDIEGAELKALQGAIKTIATYKPCIVVEDKGLSGRFGSKKGDIEKWLASVFGYTVRARVHRDTILTC